MSKIRIKLLEESDLHKLYQFELYNKDFFDSVGLSRGDTYYDINNFTAILKEIIAEQEEGLVYMYLIIDDSQAIVGRVNLLSVVRGSLNKAELGFRIGRQHQGKGYGTKAVKLILDEAINIHKLHRIEAGTSPDNIGSQIVLIKNGFQFSGRNSKYIYQNGQWQDSVNFEKVLD